MQILFVTFISILVHAGSFGLKVGEKAPHFESTDVSTNKSFSLRDELKDQGVILVFYRGGWCPYCNTQLRRLQKEVAPQLKGWKLVAISVDRVQEGAKTLKDQKLDFTVLSDPKAEILKTYNVSYKVPEELVKKYKNSYQIDLEKASGQTHHIIAVPAVFVINQDQSIRFAYANENYKVRAQTADILKSIR